jgi:hypothetical protein
MNAHVGEWSSHPAKVITSTLSSRSHVTEPSGAANRIPDWAAIAVLMGGALAVGGFVVACFSSSGFATLGMTLGLVIAALGLRAAERAVQTPTMWRPLADD